MATEAEIRKALAPMKNRTPVAGGDTPAVSFDKGKKKGLSIEENIQTMFGAGKATDFANQWNEFKANLRLVQGLSPGAKLVVPKETVPAPRAQSSTLGVVRPPTPKPPKLAVQKVATPKKRVTTGRRRAFGGKGGLASLRSRSLRGRNS